MSAEPPEPDRLEGAPHPSETPLLFGQTAAEAAYLAAAAAGRLPQAWLLTGPRGTGKATLAWSIARHLIAGAVTPSLAVDPDSPLFRQTSARAHPGLFLCRRPLDDKGERLRTAIPVDEIRALTAFFRLSAPDAGWRVAIVDSADELNGAAANALLKILEEPPPRGALLLIAHAPARLLPTIRSRCRVLRLAPLGPADLGRALAQAGVAAEGREDALAELGQGSVGAAFDLAVSDGLALYTDLASLVAAGSPLDRLRIAALADAATGRGAEDRYAATLRLTDLLLGRLARSAAGAAQTPVDPAEVRAFARLAATPRQARIWAEIAGRLGPRIAHARAVNLDPAQVILDTFLQIDAAAAEADARAA